MFSYFYNGEQRKYWHFLLYQNTSALLKIANRQYERGTHLPIQTVLVLRQGPDPND